MLIRLIAHPSFFLLHRVLEGVSKQVGRFPQSRRKGSPHQKRKPKVRSTWLRVLVTLVD